MSKSKYYCQIKVSSKRKKLEDGKIHEDIIWLHSNNLLSLCDYLDRRYPDWKWFNVFDNRNKSQQIASYTKNNRPSHKFVLTYEKYGR